MTQEEKELLIRDLCTRLPYDCKVAVADGGIDGLQWNIVTLNSYLLYQIEEEDGWEYVKPYLRPMSSMTEEEKNELLCAVIGKDAVKYFQVLSDGSIDNTDSAHQDLHNFTMHWVNFDGSSTTAYIDWLNKNHFDYRGLIEKGLAIEVSQTNNPYKS